MPSLQRACVALSLSFNRWSRNAWQSVSISTENPHMMFENLSSANFNAANSRRKGLYFSSDFEVLLDANAIGCSRFTVFPLGSTVSNLSVRTAPKAFLQPSVVTMNGVPSHLGPFSTGSDVMAAFRAMNALVCSSFQWSFSLKLDM